MAHRRGSQCILVGVLNLTVFLVIDKRINILVPMDCRIF